MTAAVAGKAKSGGARKNWQRVHLIYFLLAAFDLMAVMGGLYLSNQLSGLIDQSAKTSWEWDQRVADVWRLRSLFSPMSDPANQIFEFLDPHAAQAKFDRSYAIAASRLSGLSEQFGKTLDKEHAEMLQGQLSRVAKPLAQAKNEAGQLFSSYTAGNIPAASKNLAKFNRLIREADLRLERAVELIRSIKELYNRDYISAAGGLKTYEYLIGGFIIVMVICVVFYGHSMGRLLRNKYLELESAHDALNGALAGSQAYSAKLEDINSDVSRLNRELADSMAMLRDAQDEIVRKGKLAQLGHLTATVAHELRNPLGAVKTSAYVVERRTKDKGLGLEAQMLRIQNGINRCDGIITQLLDFSRSTPLDCEPCDFDGWVAGIVEEEAGKLPDVLAIECELGTSGKTAMIDPARLRRAIINLLANASEAMVGKGDGTSKFIANAPCITVVTSHTARGFEIAVRDNGPGISNENLRKIRDPLFTTKNFGTGLGIPAVEQIAELHGGGLDIRSEEGKGASFTIWIPALAAQSSAA